MALSFSAVQKAYEVFHKLKESRVIDLDIKSYPEDVNEWDKQDWEHLHENRVYGIDRKSDDGWESLIFFVRNPSEELKTKFNELKNNVPNSSICRPYSEDNKLWKFGWF